MEMSNQPPNLSIDKKSKLKISSNAKCDKSMCSNDFRVCFILQQCKNANLEVVCMQEVHQLHNDIIAYLGSNLFWTGLKGIRQHGVRIIICKSEDLVIDIS